MGSGARLSFFPVNKRNKTEFLTEFPLLLDWYALANIRIISPTLPQMLCEMSEASTTQAAPPFTTLTFSGANILFYQTVNISTFLLYHLINH